MGTQGNEENIIDLQLKKVKKQRFRINGESDKILELNTSDISIISRLKMIYPKLQTLAEDALTFSDEELNDNTPEGLFKFADKLDRIDENMGNLLDEIFDANVSETCKDGGKMYDLFDGMFRFEHIIETLSTLYSTGFDAEFAKVRQRIDKHTGKYIRK